MFFVEEDDLLSTVYSIVFSGVRYLMMFVVYSLKNIVSIYFKNYASFKFIYTHVSHIGIIHVFHLTYTYIHRYILFYVVHTDILNTVCKLISFGHVFFHLPFTLLPCLLVTTCTWPGRMPARSYFKDAARVQR